MAGNEKTGPGLGLKYGYVEKEDGWGPGYNRNARVLDWAANALVQREGMGTGEPPEDAQVGYAYVVSDNPGPEWEGHAGHIALCTDDPAEPWLFIVPYDGFEVRAPYADEELEGVNDYKLVYMQGDWRNIGQEVNAFAYGTYEDKASPTAQGIGSMAWGFSSGVWNNYGIAIGFDSVVWGEGGTAIGTSANATSERSTALGYRTTANEPFTLSVGSKGSEFTPDFTTRIVNVTPGVDPTDAATVSQLAQAGGNFHFENSLGSVDLTQNAFIETLALTDQKAVLTTNSIPVGCEIIGVAYRVMAGITGSTGINLGLSNVTNAQDKTFTAGGAFTGVSAGTTNPFVNAFSAPMTAFGAIKLQVSVNDFAADTFTAGSIKVAVAYRRMAATLNATA